MKKNLLKIITIFSFLTLFPILVFADSSTSTCSTLTGLGQMICTLQNLLNSVIPLLVALAIVVFVWGIIRYVIAAGEEAKTKGRDYMIYGLIGLTVIVSLWGIVNIIINTFGLGGVSAPTLSTIAAQSACTVPTSGSTLPAYLNYVTCIINSSIIPLIFTVAIVMFVWGVVKFFFIDADEEAKRAQGKQYMIWGIIALAVMLSIWGLVAILGATFGIQSTSVLPQVHPPTQ
jgi:hypothetical protein